MTEFLIFSSAFPFKYIGSLHASSAQDAISKAHTVYNERHAVIQSVSGEYEFWVEKNAYD